MKYDIANEITHRFEENLIRIAKHIKKLVLGTYLGYQVNTRYVSTR